MPNKSHNDKLSGSAISFERDASGRVDNYYEFDSILLYGN